MNNYESRPVILSKTHLHDPTGPISWGVIQNSPKNLHKFFMVATGVISDELNCSPILTRNSYRPLLLLVTEKPFLS